MLAQQLRWNDCARNSHDIRGIIVKISLELNDILKRAFQESFSFEKHSEKFLNPSEQFGS